MLGRDNVHIEQDNEHQNSKKMFVLQTGNQYETLSRKFFPEKGDKDDFIEHQTRGQSVSSFSNSPSSTTPKPT
jgi:hypothetical protein